MPVLAQFNQDQYAATDQVRCIKVYIPDDDSYLPLLGGLLALGGDRANYQEPESAQAEGVAAVWRDAYIQTDWSECDVPASNMLSEANLWAYDFVPSGGSSALAFNTSAGLFHDFWANPSAPALGWHAETTRFLAAGTWAFSLIWHRQTNCGVTEIDAIGLTSGTTTVIDVLDMRGAALNNQIRRGTFTLADDEEFSIKIYNAGTTGVNAYNIQWTLLQLVRTADP